MKINKEIFFVFMCVISGFVSCHKNMDAQMSPVSRTDTPQYRFGVYVDAAIDSTVQKKIVTDLTYFGFSNVVMGDMFLSDVKRYALSVDTLIKANHVSEIKTISSAYHYIALFYVQENKLMFKAFNFVTGSTVEQDNTESIQLNKNWICTDRTGFLCVTTRPESAEVYINYNLLGWTPIAVILNDDTYQVSVIHGGVPFFEGPVKVPDISEISLNNVDASIESQMDRDGMALTSDEKTGAAVISSIMILSIIAAVVIPIILL